MVILLINFLRVQRYGDIPTCTRFLQLFAPSSSDSPPQARQSCGKGPESCRITRNDHGVGSADHFPINGTDPVITDQWNRPRDHSATAV